MTHPFPIGTRVVKIGTNPGEPDLHLDGALGTVMGYIGPSPKPFLDFKGQVIEAGTYGYIVAFDDMPADIHVFIAGWRLVPAPSVS